MTPLWKVLLNILFALMDDSTGDVRVKDMKQTMEGEEGWRSGAHIFPIILAIE